MEKKSREAELEKLRGLLLSPMRSLTCLMALILKIRFCISSLKPSDMTSQEMRMRAWWYSPGIPALGRQSQEDLSRPVWDTEARKERGRKGKRRGKERHGKKNKGAWA
jgi:hypothetical protein